MNTPAVSVIRFAGSLPLQMGAGVVSTCLEEQNPCSLPLPLGNSEAGRPAS